MHKYADNVAAALSRTDPSNKAYYAQRLQSYKAELTKLDGYARTQFNSAAQSARH